MGEGYGLSSISGREAAREGSGRPESFTVRGLCEEGHCDHPTLSVTPTLSPWKGRAGICACWYVFETYIFVGFLVGLTRVDVFLCFEILKIGFGENYVLVVVVRKAMSVCVICVGEG